MSMIIVTIVLIAIAHFCRIKGDNVAALGFAGLAIFFLFPSLPASLLTGLGQLFESNQETLAALLGPVIVLGCCLFGLKTIFLGKR